MTDIRDELIDTEYEPPRGQIETAVAHIQADVLDVDRVGRSDSFYDFGGTSLQAIRICARVERETGRQAEPAWLFEADVLSDFVSRLPEPEAGAEAGSKPPPATKAATTRLSEGQVALWLSGLVRPERAIGNVVVLAYRMSPAPPKSDLLQAIRTFAARHQGLATAIMANDEGDPQPVVLSSADALYVSDSDGVDGSLQERAKRLAEQVDVETGPLACTRVDPIPEGSELLFVVHHACFDGHSEALFSSEVSALLRGQDLPDASASGPPPSPTRPDPGELSDWAQRLGATRDISWSRADHAGAPEATVAEVLRFETPVDSLAGLAREARSAGVSPFKLVLRAVGRALRDASMTDSFCLGVPTSIRGLESDRVVGNFIRQAVVPLGGAELDGPIDVISSTWARAHATLGVGVSELANLAGRGSGAGSRLFQVQFAWQNQPAAGWDIPGVTVTEIEVIPFTPQYDLTVELVPRADGSVRGLIEYDPKLVPASAATVVAERIRAWFDQVAAA